LINKCKNNIFKINFKKNKKNFVTLHCKNILNEKYMKYIGLSAQKAKNNFKSTLLLILFPVLVVGLTLIGCIIFNFFILKQQETYYDVDIISVSMKLFIHIVPIVICGILIWFLIAYFINSAIINKATGSKPLERKENKRIYNLVENLCMGCGMSMPKINIIYDDSLNAFASGLNKRNYTVTLTSGIIKKLNDQELEAVIAHELTHIRNHDVRLLIISIVFVGIFSMLAQLAMRMVFFNNSGRSNNKKDGGLIIIIVLILAIVGYLFAIFMRFAISRQREYMADAGSSEMTKNPLALANALRKISADPIVENVTRDDVAQLFISHPLKKEKKSFSFFSNLFATHPPIEKRIEFLEQL